MSILSETIFYIWLLPVVAQIVLPLGMLAVWLLYRFVSLLNPKAMQHDEATLPGKVTKAKAAL